MFTVEIENILVTSHSTFRLKEEQEERGTPGVTSNKIGGKNENSINSSLFASNNSLIFNV